MKNEKTALALKHLVVKHGDGCEYCNNDETVLERNRCPYCKTVWAVRDISLNVYEGEILGVVGESGSGKSTLMKSLYMDIEPTGYLLGMVYQNPYLGLRMFFSSGANVAEKLIAAGNRNVADMMNQCNKLLSHMEVPVSRVKEPPRNFSGGMQQRVQIAKAIANHPPILFLDEVTTGLDLSVQAKVLDLVKRIQLEYGITMIVVSHDLAVIRMLADRTIVMLDGRIVEEGLTDQIMEDPQHVYTQTLVNSLL